MVNSLYDHAITFRHKELREAWKSLFSAEHAIAKSDSAKAARAKSSADEARKLASQIPIDAFKSNSGLKAQLETDWENFARNNYAKAKELAAKAAAMAK